MTNFFRKKFRLFRRRLRADGTKGAAGIEFAFIAPVFFTLLFDDLIANIDALVTDVHATRAGNKTINFILIFVTKITCFHAEDS